MSTRCTAIEVARYANGTVDTADGSNAVTPVRRWAGLRSRAQRWSGEARLWAPSRGLPFHRAAVSPIFVVGCGRSGSTLLRRLLVTSPGLHIPPETYVLGPTIRQFARLRNKPWDLVVHATVARFAFHPEWRHMETDLAATVPDLLRTPEDERSLERVLDVVYRATAPGTEVTRWGDKTPYNTYFLPEIDRTFPDARYVHMIRNPYDAVASYLKMGAYRSAGEAADRWRSSVSRVRKFQRSRPDRIVEIRYAELVSDPVSVGDLLTERLHLEAVDGGSLHRTTDTSGLGDVHALDHHRRVVEPVTTDRIGRGADDLTAKQKALVRTTIGELWTF